MSLAKGTATSVSAFLPELANQELNYLPDWIILDIWALLMSTSVETLLVKAFPILDFCLVVRSNTWDNSSSWKFFLVIVNVAPVLLFATDFNLFSCAFFSLTIASS